MSYFYKRIVVLFFVFLAGCVSMTPEAASVMIHSQVSSLLDDCERLGNVTSNVSAWGKMNWAQVEQQAEINIRHEAYNKYGADTVAIVNIDKLSNSRTIQGIAFKCDR